MKRILICCTWLLMLVSFSGCKKWLELKPQDGIVREDFWKTKEQVQAGVTGIYASLLGNSNGDVPIPEYLFLWGEARGDMMIPGFRASGDEIDMVNINTLPTNYYINWRYFYQTINYCNTVIELAPAVLQSDNTFSQEQLNEAVAQALALRSLMYFYLVRSFGEVPLKLDATISDQDLAAIPKSSQDTVLNQIVKDLKAAEPNLPLSYGNINTDKGRITRYTANAILADVYLWMDKYNESIAECDKIINSRRFALVAGTSFFNQVFVNGNSAEGIFELQYDAQKLNPFYNMHLASTRRWGAAAHLTEFVYGIDAINAPPKEDIRGAGCAYRASDLTIWKYIGVNAVSNTIRSADQSYAHWIFYRYADILLLKAEAINQLSRPLEASRIVKTIRERANAVDFDGAMDSTSKASMTDYILGERQREFAFEGKRWYDLLRNAKRNNYERLDLLLRAAAYSVAPDRQQSAFSKLRDKNSHYFPIYFYELQTNKLLVQNPFYK
ncbi:MAG: RagB/SusD family nutrient uptake outer membrane protein [Chitinophagaceae bacterium]